MTLDEARDAIGADVVYRAALLPEPLPMWGVITSVSNSWVFVRYGTHQTSQATHPKWLELLARGTFTSRFGHDPGIIEGYARWPDL